MVAAAESCIGLRGEETMSQVLTGHMIVDYLMAVFGPERLVARLRRVGRTLPHGGVPRIYYPAGRN